MRSELVLLGVLCLWCLVGSHAGGATTTVAPGWQDWVFEIPMRIESPRGRAALLAPFKKSPLKLRLRAKAYDSTIGALAERPELDEAEQALIHFVRAVQRGDLQKVSDLTREGHDAMWRFSELVRAWSEIETQPLYYQISVGPYLYFLFRQSTEFGATAPFLQERGRLVTDRRTYIHPMGQVLSYLSDVLVKQGDDFRAVRDAAGDRCVEMPWNEGDGSGPPIAVCFDGAAVDWPLFGGGTEKREAPPWADAPLRAYREAVQALSEGRVGDYLAHIGPSSREFAQEWLGNPEVGYGGIELGSALALKKRRVVYAIRGAGIVLLFHHDWPLPLEPLLDYTFLATTPEGQWQLVNVNSKGGIDRLLAWPPFQKALLNAK